MHVRRREVQIAKRRRLERSYHSLEKLLVALVRYSKRRRLEVCEVPIAEVGAVPLLCGRSFAKLCRRTNRAGGAQYLELRKASFTVYVIVLALTDADVVK